MNDQTESGRAAYYEKADSWSKDRDRFERRSARVAWIIAGVSAAVAILEAIALVALTPLKTVVPYTLLVDRQTGYVQALKPLEREIVAPDAALTRSFLAQYVLAREGFDIDTLTQDYRKVALWSAGEARAQYVARIQGTNPASPLVVLPRRALVDTEIRSISSLNANTAFVRFATFRTDPGGPRQEPELWAAVIKYRYSSGDMSAADRLTNPLGFQITSYRRTPELPPEIRPPSIPTAEVAPSSALTEIRRPVVRRDP